jgi:hypothetical protein
MDLLQEIINKKNNIITTAKKKMRIDNHLYHQIDMESIFFSSLYDAHKRLDPSKAQLKTFFYSRFYWDIKSALRTLGHKEKKWNIKTINITDEIKQHIQQIPDPNISTSDLYDTFLAVSIKLHLTEEQKTLLWEIITQDKKKSPKQIRLIKTLREKAKGKNLGREDIW